MSYWDISLMAADPDLTARISACAAQENTGADPVGWALANGLKLAASPGWADAWASALAGGNENPGRDPAVITDEDILSAVQAAIADT